MTNLRVLSTTLSFVRKTNVILRLHLLTRPAPSTQNSVIYFVHLLTCPTPLGDGVQYCCCSDGVEHRREKVSNQKTAGMKCLFTAAEVVCASSACRYVFAPTPSSGAIGSVSETSMDTSIHRPKQCATRTDNRFLLDGLSLSGKK